MSNTEELYAAIDRDVDDVLSRADRLKVNSCMYHYDNKPFYKVFDKETYERVKELAALRTRVKRAGGVSVSRVGGVDLELPALGALMLNLEQLSGILKDNVDYMSRTRFPYGI